MHILDLNPPNEDIQSDSPGIEFSRCNVVSWGELRSIFERIGHVDMVFANAGVSEETDYFRDTHDKDGFLLEPRYGVIDVNYRAVLNVIKLSLSAMRKQGTGGSIVLTTSATAYAPEQSLPVYSATKLAVSFLAQWSEDVLSDFLNVMGHEGFSADCSQLVGLVRSLRSTIIHEGISINAVAPAATITSLLPQHLADPIMAAGLPVSSAQFVGLALVYSATAQEIRQVEAYGKEKDSEMERKARWNGRVILTLGDRYTEIEGPVASLREQWFGEENTRLTRMQQAATDFRKGIHSI